MPQASDISGTMRNVDVFTAFWIPPQFWTPPNYAFGHDQSDGPYTVQAVDDRIDQFNPTGTNVLLTYDDCSAIRSRCVYFEDPTTGLPPPLDDSDAEWLAGLSPVPPYNPTRSRSRSSRGRSPSPSRSQDVIDLVSDAEQRRRKKKRTTRKKSLKKSKSKRRRKIKK